MVWPFSSTASSSNSSPPLQEPNRTNQPPIFPPDTPPVTEPTRDDVADKELKLFLAEFEASATPPLPTRPKFTRRSSPAITSSPNPESISEHVLPTTMSCRQAFDAAFYCNSFGGRFNDLYRYGTLRSCSDTWSDFWFCMKTRTYAEPHKSETIKGHYREKDRKKYGGDRAFAVEEQKQDKDKEGLNDGLGEGVGVLNYRGRGSEDIWKSRDRLVEAGTAFREPILGWDRGGDKHSDAEWNEREKEKRKVDATRLGKA